MRLPVSSRHMSGISDSGITPASASARKASTLTWVDPTRRGCSASAVTASVW